MKKEQLKKFLKLPIVFTLCIFFSFYFVQTVYADCCVSSASECPHPAPDETVICRPALQGEECYGTGICDYISTGSSGHVINWRNLKLISVPKLVDTSVGGIITILIRYVFYAAGFLLLIYLVLGGFQILTSSGDPKQMAAGREKITYAVVGFIIMFSAYLIVRLVGRILDIEQIIMIFG